MIYRDPATLRYNPALGGWFSDIVDTVTGTVAKVAPIVGSVFGGTIGGAIGSTVGSIIPGVVSGSVNVNPSAAAIAAARAAIVNRPAPTWWDEALYIFENPDIVPWVNGTKLSGWAHWDNYARTGTDRPGSRARIVPLEQRYGYVTAAPIATQQYLPGTPVSSQQYYAAPAAAESSTNTIMIAGVAALGLLLLMKKK